MTTELHDNISDTFKASIELSKKAEQSLLTNPEKHRILTGDRPTGNLHIGHFIGSVQNRIKIQNLGVETFIIIADYQVLTDHDAHDKIAQYSKELVIDYLACGLDADCGKTFFFPHSQIPELNQLLLPFLTLMSTAELERNPTVKDEIKSAGLSTINAGMFVYPIHQACDILFCDATVVPVGKDQLAHLESTRVIAKRFNKKYAPIFKEPIALLSEMPMVKGLDGTEKMSKSRNNTIMLKASEDETVAAIKKAKTDSDRIITYDPINRPEVANLIEIISIFTKEDPRIIADKISDRGAAGLKSMLAETINETLRPVREKRKLLESDPEYIENVIKRGVDKIRPIAQEKLAKVLEVMNMKYF